MRALLRLFQTPTTNRIAAGFIMAMVLIATGFVMSFQSYTRYSEDSSRIEHTHRVINTLEDILSMIKDVEMAARGYVLTNDTAFLEPYQAALPRLPMLLNQLDKLVKDNALQKQRTDTLKRLTTDKLQYVRRQIATVQASGGRQSLRLDKGRMDRIRGYVSQMIATEQALMTERNAQARQSFRNALLIVFALSVLTFISIIISYNLLEGELANRERSEATLIAYENELKERIRQLEASNEELERFAFVASHDLQEPLRKIQSFGNLLHQRYDPVFDEEGRMYLNKITQSAGRMSKMIKDLLNFSRISNRHDAFAQVPLGDVVQGVLEDQELRVKALDVDVQVDRLPVIMAVPSQIDHLFANLISNALKFTRKNVRPLLHIRCEPVDGSNFPELIAGKKYFCVSIKDNGIGFDEKYLDHIFKVFQRLHGKNAYEGTGIGLAICKRVVLYHRGHITAHSQPGQGATFVIVLPEKQMYDDYDRSVPDEARTHTIG